MLKILIEKYKKISKPVKATFFYTIIVFLQSAVSLITTPIFTRLLSTSDYGITNLYNSWYNVISILITLNLSYGVYNNALLEFEKDRDKVTSSFLSISILLSTLAFIIFIIFRNFFVELFDLPQSLIYFMIINCITIPAWAFFINRQKFDYKYTASLILSCVMFVLNPILGILGINLFPSNKAIAKVIFSGLPNIILGFILIIVTYKNGKCFFNKKLWKYALKFNIPLIPHYLSNVILSQSDRIMISKICGESYAGIYSVSYNISNVVNGVLTGINSAWVPFTYKSLKSKSIDKIRKNTNYILFIVALSCVGVILIAPEVIRILATEEYLSAIWIIPPVIFGIFFNFVASIFANVEFYYKKSYFVTVATTVAGIINIILNYIFIPKFGFVAAGYTTLIGYIVLCIMHFIFMKRLTKENIYNIKNIVLICFISTIIITIITMLYRNFIMRYSLLLILLVIIIFNYKRIIKIYNDLKK